MLAFPVMLVSAAKDANMSVPDNPDDFDREKFPHFAVFCNTQLGTRMSEPNIHFENAKVIAKIPDDEIKKVTIINLYNLGYRD